MFIPTGELVAQCSLRLLKPACYLDQRWSEEPLDKQTRRSVNLLHSLTVPPAKGTPPPGPSPDPFPAPTFAYCFPLLARAVEKGAEVVGGDQEIIVKVLDVMSRHAKLRAETEVQDTEEGGQYDEVSRCRNQSSYYLREVVSVSKMKRCWVFHVV